MKLARTTLFVICTNDLGRAGRNYRQPCRPNAHPHIRYPTILKPTCRQVARLSADAHSRDLTQLPRKMPCHE